MIKIFVSSLLDILIITVIIYRLIKFSRDPRVLGVILFFAIIILIRSISGYLGLFGTSFLAENITAYSALAIIILFQPEIRRAILGLDIKFFPSNPKTEIINEILDACVALSKTKTGALIVIQRAVNLEQIVQGGLVIDSKLSKELIISIFQRTSPLHDGAIIIKDTKILKAGCIISRVSDMYDTEVGLRHKAAVGITEETDAVAIAVSEETGNISLSLAGKIYKGISPGALKEQLTKSLSGIKK